MATKQPLEVIAELKELFEIESKENVSHENDGVFYISKQHMTREEVIQKLRNYFHDVIFDHGYLELKPMTFVYTRFKVFNFLSEL